jgi:hypothetical protein
MASLLATLCASCLASYTSTTKEETRADGTKTTESTTTVEGQIAPNGGTIRTDGKSVEVTVESPSGTTTENPAPGEPVPVPEGSTSVETKETVKPHVCPTCGQLHRLRVAGGRVRPPSHDHAAYHRFERYVAHGQWEAFMYAEDASATVSGESAARDLWRELVVNTSSGFAYAPSQPPELSDVRFYGMRFWEENGQVYVSIADVKPFSSLSLTLREAGTSNAATFNLDTPGTLQTSINGWYFASIPIDFVPTNMVDPVIVLTPVIRNEGTPITKGYVRTFGW